jgi:hypothetical protein
MRKKTKPEAKPPHHWAQCFLEHAARETAWIAQHMKECNYISAHNAQIRREVWLYAALLAQDKGK